MALTFVKLEESSAVLIGNQNGNRPLAKNIVISRMTPLITVRNALRSSSLLAHSHLLFTLLLNQRAFVTLIFRILFSDLEAIMSVCLTAHVLALLEHPVSDKPEIKHGSRYSPLWLRRLS